MIFAVNSIGDAAYCMPFHVSWELGNAFIICCCNNYTFVPLEVLNSPASSSGNGILVTVVQYSDQLHSAICIFDDEATVSLWLAIESLLCNFR